MASDSEQPAVKKQKMNDDAELTVKSLLNCDFTNQISVLVGLDEEVFLVHKDIICAKSKFFVAACSKSWLEGQEKQVKLPEVDVSLFQSYLTWIYCGQLNITCFSNEDINKLSCQSSRTVAKYLELCFLGDVLDDVHLRNKVLQTLVLGADNMLHVQTVQRVWEKTPNNSPVRRMMVDRATLRGQRTHLLENLNKFPEDFVQQVTAALLKEVPTKDQESFTARLPSYLEPVEMVD